MSTLTKRRAVSSTDLCFCLYNPCVPRYGVVSILVAAPHRKPSAVDYPQGQAVNHCQLPGENFNDDFRLVLAVEYCHVLPCYSSSHMVAGRNVFSHFGGVLGGIF